LAESLLGSNAALVEIPRGGYENWSKVIMALSTVFEKSSRGLEVAQRWSATCPEKYNSTMVEQLYCNADGRLKMGTLIRLSSQVEARPVVDVPLPSYPESDLGSDSGGSDTDGEDIGSVDSDSDADTESHHPRIASARVGQLRAAAVSDGLFDAKRALELRGEHRFEPCTFRGWVKEFHGWWPSGRPTPGDGAKLFDRELKSLLDLIVDYVSEFHCKIVGQDGQPEVIVSYRSKVVLASRSESDQRDEASSESQEVTKFVRKLQQHLTAAHVASGFQPDKKLKKRVNPLTIWWASTRALEKDRMVFDPREPSHSRRSFNLFSGFAVPVSQVVCESEALLLRLMPCLRHLRDVICDGNEEHYEFVLCWISHLYQRPWVKMPILLMFIGPQGCGKGFLVDLLFRILGDQYCETLVGQTAFLDGFNSAKSKTNLLVKLDEFYLGPEAKSQSKFKNQVTETSRVINEKNHGIIELENRSHYIALLNLSAPQPCLPRDDRRCFVARSSSAIQGGARNPRWREYFTRLWNTKSGDFAAFLVNCVDITNFEYGSGS
jgi:hypothetical protein